MERKYDKVYNSITNSIEYADDVLYQLSLNPSLSRDIYFCPLCKKAQLIANIHGRTPYFRTNPLSIHAIDCKNDYVSISNHYIYDNNSSKSYLTKSEKISRIQGLSIHRSIYKSIDNDSNFEINSQKDAHEKNNKSYVKKSTISQIKITKAFKNKILNTFDNFNIRNKKIECLIYGWVYITKGTHNSKYTNYYIYLSKGDKYPICSIGIFNKNTSLIEYIEKFLEQTIHIIMIPFIGISSDKKYINLLLSDLESVLIEK